MRGIMSHSRLWYVLIQPPSPVAEDGIVYLLLLWLQVQTFIAFSAVAEVAVHMYRADYCTTRIQHSLMALLSLNIW